MGDGRRRWSKVGATLSAVLVAAGALVAVPAHGDGAGPPPSASAPPPAPPPPRKVKRVIDAIELGVAQKLPFKGSLRLKIVSGHEGPPLTYYWGGKCARSKLTGARLELLYRAMRDRVAVEIPARPIRYRKRVFLCMESVRLINE